MPSIIRVKRKRNDDPAEALLISCKRKKLDEKSDAANRLVSKQVDENVFLFATTVKMQKSMDEEDRAKVRDAISTRMRYAQRSSQRHVGKSNSNGEHCFASLKNKLKSVRGQKRTSGIEKDVHSKQTTSNSGDKSRSTEKSRPLSGDATPAKQPKQGGASEEATSITVAKNKDKNFDDILCNSVKMIREKLNVSEPKDDYVVDVYYCSKDMDWKQHDILNIKPCKYEDFLWELSDDEAQEPCDDEDDSNDEGNWRNDYPDEDSMDDDDRRCIYDEEECNSDNRESRDCDYYEGSYCDFEQILDDYNPHADNYDDFPVRFEGESDDDY